MLTIVNAYYCNADMLAEQYRRFRNLPEWVRSQIQYIVTDDSTPEPYAPAWGEKIPEMSVKVFRCTGPDIPWNYAFARNVGCKHADNPFLFVTDIDHVLPECTLLRLLDMLRACELFPVVKGQRNDRVLYKPTHRVRMHDGSLYKTHPDTYLCTKRFWCDILGYHDERFRGGYGGDYDHKERILKRAHIDESTLGLPMLLFGRDVIPDASTFNLERKSAEQKARVARIRRELKNAGTLDAGESFLSPYELVFES